jgi:DNA-directed RNA polymerase specialized sigma24 family protein
MAAPNKRRSQKFAPAWHRVFLRMLPKILSYARTAFGHLRAEAREDLVQEVVANACVAFKGLWDRGKQALAYPTVLANYGIRQVRDHRKVGGKLNIKDVLSKYAQQRKGFVVERLDKYDDEEQCWLEILVPDNTCTPAELAASRIDFPAWLKTLKPRDRKVARFLSFGNRTQDAARKFDVSQGRISQLRKELQELVIGRFRTSQREALQNQPVGFMLGNVTDLRGIDKHLPTPKAGAPWALAGSASLPWMSGRCPWTRLLHCPGCEAGSCAP